MSVDQCVLGQLEHALSQPHSRCAVRLRDKLIRHFRLTRRANDPQPQPTQMIAFWVMHVVAVQNTTLA